MQLLKTKFCVVYILKKDLLGKMEIRNNWGTKQRNVQDHRTMKTFIFALTVGKL